MKTLIGRAGALAVLAAIFAVAILAAVMIAARPVAAQAQPRILAQALGTTGSIGVGIRDVTNDDATKARMAQPAGVYIESVREDSPAAKAGMQSGDIVIDFDGERVRSASHFTRLVQESVPDRQVAAVVIRGTSKQTLQVVPEGSNRFDRLLSNNSRRQLQGLERQLPRNFNFDADALRRSLPGVGGNLGVSVAPLSEQLASYFGVKGGVLVSAVTANSPAAEAGLRAGDVITAINGQAVASSADITRAIRDARDGGALAIAVTRDRKSLSLKATVPGRTRAPSGRGGFPV
jgi:serine protease Do